MEPGLFNLLIDFCFPMRTIDNMSSFWFCDLPGCGHPVPGQPGVEELHPRLHVQRLRPGADSRELVQARQTHVYVFR